MRRRLWSCSSPAGWSSQRTMSHRISAMESTLSVYTFSFTTDWFHTVNPVAAISAPAAAASRRAQGGARSEEHTSELQSRLHLVCRLLLEKKKKNQDRRVRGDPPDTPQSRQKLAAAVGG